MVDMIFEPCANCTTFIQKFHYIDSLTDVGFGGILGLLFLLIIGSALFLMMKAYSAEKGFAVSMLITGILGIMFAIIGLVTDKTIYIFIILLVIALFLLFRSNDSPGY